MNKSLVFICSALLLLGCKSKQESDTETATTENGYVDLYNGKNMDNWINICRKQEAGLPERVFTAGENGEMHVYKDFADGHGFEEERNETHCMFFTKEEYSKYSFKFEYKWGTKRFNNFDQFQYDAGMYFHVYDVKIWPKGVEYQVRYNHLEERNHTGDIWNSGASFDWTASNDSTYLSVNDGGKVQEHRGGEHRAHKEADYHALNGQWNQCEVIVMGNKFAVFKLNGKVVNVLTNLSHTKGFIGLQAETAEIFYRNIKIKKFENDIPMKQFLND